jgi:glutamyl-tRNA reductase
MRNELPIAVIGISHKSAEVGKRENAALSVAEQALVMRELRTRFQLRGCLALSTCNRTEIYLSADDLRIDIEAIRAWLDWFKQSKVYADHDLCYDLAGDKACLHLFAVMAGMESQVLGEPQIAGQVKESYQRALEQGATDAYLNKLFNFGMQAQKAVRNNTFLTDGAVSVSFAGVELARKIYRDLDGRKALLVGAGDTAELAARHFLDKGIAEIHIANRTLHNAEILAEKLHGRAYDLQQLDAILSEVDIVISATSSKDYVITKGLMQEVAKKRRFRSIFLIDLAIPRDIDPQINDIDGVFAYNLDDLNEVIRLNLEKREDELPRARRILTDYLREFHQWFNNHSLGATIALLRERFEDIRHQEIEQIRSKLKNNGLEQIDLLTKSLMNKIIKRHIVSLKSSLQDPPRYELHKQLLEDTFAGRKDDEDK